MPRKLNFLKPLNRKKVGNKIFENYERIIKIDCFHEQANFPSSISEDGDVFNQLRESLLTKGHSRVVKAIKRRKEK